MAKENHMDREEIISAMLSDYKNDLSALSDNDLIECWKQTRKDAEKMRKMTDRQLDRILRKPL
jgi:hypothetical protein